MPIANLEWRVSGETDAIIAARDIHLTRNLSSPRLDQLLWVSTTQDPGHVHRVDDPLPNDPWTVTFTPSYVLSAGRQYNQFNYGVKVDTGTGEVTVDAQLPAGPRLYSFIITATVSQGTAKQLRTRIRVHIHDQVTSKWLTPEKLTVRQGAKNMRFSVLASFDDGVIGDITNWAPADATPFNAGDRAWVHAVGSAAPAHRWSGTGATTGMTVDPVTGEIRSPQPSGFVTVNLIDAGGTAASATAFGAPPWSTPVNLTRIAGPGFPAMSRADVRNVLFLPDGFVDDPISTDKIDYEFYVRELVHLMNTNSQTRPYDVLSAKFNYFSAWVPSPQAGCSALPEMFNVDPADAATSHLKGWDVELPEHPTGSPAKLTLEQLIDTVGLPTPVGDPPNSPPGTAAAGRVHDWAQLFDPLMTLGRITDADPDLDAYSKWLRRDTRVLLNERDTAFHVAASSRPRIDVGRSAAVELGFHPLRLTTADFDTFLKALRDDKGNPVPAVWPDGGKDDRLIVIICRTDRHSGENNSRGAEHPDGHQAAYLCVPLGSRSTREWVPVGKGVDLVPAAIPDHVDPAPWAIMAHELAHSFVLGDEYGYSGTLSAGEVSFVHGYNNLQERVALTTNDRLVAANIKWRWRRLRQAGVLRAPAAGADPVRPHPSVGGQFLIAVRRAHSAAFADPQADIVRLRTAGPQRNPRFSDRLRLIGVSPGELTVKLMPNSQFEPREWTAGDLVVAPVRGADPDYQHDVLGPDLELVHKDVVDRINATSNPLNALPTDALNRGCVSPAAANAPRDEYANFLTRPARPRILHRTVGLYEGGAQVECGVYHPTGECMMNLGYDRNLGGFAIVVPFCPVCRYAMVDLIDPSGHGPIDADYDYEYPR